MDGRSQKPVKGQPKTTRSFVRWTTSYFYLTLANERTVFDFFEGLASGATHNFGSNVGRFGLFYQEKASMIDIRKFVETNLIR